MRTPLHRYELTACDSLQDALAALAADPSARPFAGGTDLMVLMDAGHLPPGRYIDLWKVRELRDIDVTAEAVTLGALTTYTEVLKAEILRREFPMLGIAAAETGGIATQNRGTIGGNIANASPAADTPPALVAYDAELELVSSRGVRRVAYEKFHTGYKKMDLAPGELIARVRLPRGRKGWRDYYRKVGTRKAQAISKVCFAAAADVADGRVRDLRVALGSVAPTVVRCTATETTVRGHAVDDAVVVKAQRALASEIEPIDDIRSTAAYRLRVAQNVLREFLTRIRA
ncbi:MAG: carbon monoxide dehydrogenase [Acidobacteria bacterium]|nr:MAG: carbon monoxide dehydrogenase [Acidobacteriota bacterium]